MNITNNMEMLTAGFSITTIDNLIQHGGFYDRSGKKKNSKRIQFCPPPLTTEVSDFFTVLIYFDSARYKYIFIIYIRLLLI